MTETLQNQPRLTESQLAAYLARIGAVRPITCDLASLQALHRAHLLNVTWEAIDAFMSWKNEFSTDAAFTKIVERGRGGWCFEMNGLFGAALSALGFAVTRLSGGVNREFLGDVAIGNHLTLQVELDRTYLAEVGVGDAILSPVPIALGSFEQRSFAFALSEAEGGWLRLHNHSMGIARSFDFRPGYSDEEKLRAAHGWLMKDPGSPFTGALAVMRHNETGYTVLQNDRLRRVTNFGAMEFQIKSADHLAETFESVFHLDVPQVDEVWNRVCDVLAASEKGRGVSARKAEAKKDGSRGGAGLKIG